jgi:spermidine synthase
MGLCNVAVGLLLLHRLRGAGVKLWPRLLPAGWTAACALTALLVGAGELTLLMEDQLYQDTVILAQDTRYQRLVVTRWRDDVRLYLDGHLQFSTVDEYRYHEALVHPAMSLAPQREHVLLLGGGDGLATREILKYRDVARVDLVDLDPAVTNLFRDNKMLSVLNEGSLRDERVTIHNDDAMRFMESMSERYDVIFMDLPDPSEPGLGKLYSRAFFTLIGRSLRAGGTFAAQCTSPFRSRAAYWSIIHTIEAARWGGEREARFHAAPYHTMVPTFGTWGFVVATTHDIDTSQIRINVPTRYLSDQLLPTLFVFPQDMNRMDAPVSLLNDPIVVRLYRDGYHQHLD